MTATEPARSRALRDRWLLAILALGLAVRLIEVDAPLIDWQSWRQADTAAIARNFFEEEGGLLYPRVDWRGATPGYAETNFPLYPYAVSLLYQLLGEAEESMGRALSALFSVVTAWLLYVLSRRWGGDLWSARCTAALFLTFPLNVFFGRAFMPEALMLLLSVAALLTFDRWLEDGLKMSLLAAWATAAACFLVKVPTCYLGFPLVALAWSRHGWGFLRRVDMWGYLAGVLLPVTLWHLHAYSLYEQTGLTFGVFGSTGYDKWTTSLLLLDPGFYALVGHRLAEAVFTPVGLALVLLGLAWWRAGEGRDWVPRVWLASLVLYLLLVPEGNRKLHYYQLPFVPIGALFAGRILGDLLGVEAAAVAGWRQRLLRYPLAARRAGVGLALAAVAGFSVSAVGPYYRPPYDAYDYFARCHAAGAVLDHVLPHDALLVVGDVDENAGAPDRAQRPTLLYYSHRKGWQITPEEFSAARLDSLAALGADYFVAAGGFVMPNRAFAADLLRRGMSFPAALPRFWNDVAPLEKARSSHAGMDRDFLVVRLDGK